MRAASSRRTLMPWRAACTMVRVGSSLRRAETGALVVHLGERPYTTWLRSSRTGLSSSRISCCGAAAECGVQRSQLLVGHTQREHPSAPESDTDPSRGRRHCGSSLRRVHLETISVSTPPHESGQERHQCVAQAGRAAGRSRAGPRHARQPAPARCRPPGRRRGVFRRAAPGSGRLRIGRERHEQLDVAVAERHQRGLTLLLGHHLAPRQAQPELLAVQRQRAVEVLTATPM